MKYIHAVLLIAMWPAALAAQERYGFVARLGVDTIAVEQVTRTADRIVSDEVDRFPQVNRHHSKITLAPNGSIRRSVMTIDIPSASSAKWKHRTVTAEYGRDTVHVTFTNGEGTRSLAFATGGQPVVPWSPQQYSLTELYFDQARRVAGDSVFIRTFYPDMQAEDYAGLPKGRILGGYARRLAGGRMEVFRHDALAGSGEGALDDAGRLLSYSGARSTYKVEVERLAAPPDVDAVTRAMTATERQHGVVADLSLRDTVRATIGAARFEIDYSRPLRRGRQLVGGVIPLGQVWRTGANAATQFTISAPITLGGLAMVPATYTLWSLPEAGKVELIINRQHGQWGTQYDSTQDLGRVPVVITQAGASVEKLNLSVVPVDQKRGRLVVEWGDFRWEVPIEVK